MYLFFCLKPTSSVVFVGECPLHPSAYEAVPFDLARKHSGGNVSSARQVVLRQFSGEL